MIILYLAAIIAIIQSYRSYPQLAPTAEELLAEWVRYEESAYISSELISMIHQSPSRLRSAGLFALLVVHGHSPQGSK